MSNQDMAEAEDFFAQADAEVRRDEPDFGKAIPLMRRASDLGSAMASYALATWYLFGKPPFLIVDYHKAVQLLEMAAVARIPEALYDLAVCYAKGAGVDKSDVKAFELYLKAALLGDADSINSVGRCYYFGIGTSENKRVAEIWFERARELDTYDAEDS
jgi:TPR repeat protein